MKRCPQCNTVFGDEVGYCLNDGTHLIAENFSLPSSSGDDFEADTIIRREPIVVDLHRENAAPNKDLNYRNQPSVEDVILKVPAKGNAGKYALFLALGLLLGGVLVLATLILTRNFYSDNAGGANNNSKPNPATISEQNETPKGSPTENQNANKINLSETASSEHGERTATGDEEFNGRVISLNAYVRSSPRKNAAQIDVLPLNDRINIERREDESSPWFYITCEHGTSGWMHGNTIEFTR